MVIGSAASRGMAASMGTSLIARAASRTSLGLGIVQEVGNRGIFVPPQGEQHAHAHGRQRDRELLA